MIHEREPSAAGHWSAEEVAPLVRHLPKARQTVLDDVTIQRENHLWSSSFIRPAAIGGVRNYAPSNRHVESESSCSAAA
jgi:hypothetical protein